MMRCLLAHSNVRVTLSARGLIGHVGDGFSEIVMPLNPLTRFSLILPADRDWGFGFDSGMQIFLSKVVASVF